MESYQTYLQKNNTLPIEDSIRIYNQMISSFAQCKTEGKEDIIEQLIKSACYYTNIRSEWEFMDNEAKSKDDINRTSAHDSFIRNLNITERMLKNENIDTSWRTELGNERKKIGDFGCFLCFITALNNR